MCIVLTDLIKGGGVAICVKNKFSVTKLVSKSISKQLKFLALNIEVAKGQQVMVVGCYRPPSAVKDSLSSLAKLLSQLDYINPSLYPVCKGWSAFTNCTEAQSLVHFYI